MKRYARVSNARTRSEAEAYLPDNYRVAVESVDGDGRPVFLIEGEDKAGWTLDDYVIPRYASGLITAAEFPADDARLVLRLSDERKRYDVERAEKLRDRNRRLAKLNALTPADEQELQEADERARADR